MEREVWFSVQKEKPFLVYIVTIFVFSLSNSLFSLLVFVFTFSFLFYFSFFVLFRQKLVFVWVCVHPPFVGPLPHPQKHAHGANIFVRKQKLFGFKFSECHCRTVSVSDEIARGFLLVKFSFVYKGIIYMKWQNAKLFKRAWNAVCSIGFHEKGYM